MLKSYEKSFGEGRLFTWPPRVATCTFAYRFKCEPSKKRGRTLFFGGDDGGLSRRGTAYRRNTCRERGQVFPLLGHAC